MASSRALWAAARHSVQYGKSARRPGASSRYDSPWAAGSSRFSEGGPVTDFDRALSINLRGSMTMAFRRDID